MKLQYNETITDHRFYDESMGLDYKRIYTHTVYANGHENKYIKWQVSSKSCEAYTDCELSMSNKLEQEFQELIPRPFEAQ